MLFCVSVSNGISNVDQGRVRDSPSARTSAPLRPLTIYVQKWVDVKTGYGMDDEDPAEHKGELSIPLCLTKIYIGGAETKVQG